MNILLVATDFKPNPGGVAELTHELAVELVRLGHAATVVADNNAPVDGQVPAQPYVVERVDLSENASRVGRVWARYRTVKHLVIVYKAHIVLNNQYDRLTFSLAWICHALSVPFCLLVHGLDINRSVGPARAAKRAMALQLCERVFCNSHYTQRLATRRGARQSRTSIVHPGVNPHFLAAHHLEIQQELHHKRAESRSRRVILTVARLVERKGVDTVLAALPEILRYHPDVLYVIVGDGVYRAELERLVSSLDLWHHVEFRGEVNDVEKHAWYDTCELFIMPNRESKGGHVEGFGIVFLEAAQHAAPVVAGCSGGTPDAVVDGITGVLVDPYSPSGVSSAVIDLLAHPQTARKLGESGRKRVMECFTWSRAARQFAKSLQALPKVTKRMSKDRAGAISPAITRDAEGR